MEMLLEIIGSWVLVIALIVLFGCNLKRSAGHSDQGCFAKFKQQASEDGLQQQPSDIELEAHSTR